ncbi:hypothetical protein EVG20_g5399 [Dentipellis fragilis]|uniref:Uncharacterized protein n=1 Tax=Dentipellis fragilis TaxID=205917 RepID=A0A4Y9YVD5_9AGAM|nr:hypothetical protein EVG20_g5399 [Dentipellis fragilis]
MAVRRRGRLRRTLLRHAACHIFFLPYSSGSITLTRHIQHSYTHCTMRIALFGDRFFFPRDLLSPPTSSPPNTTSQTPNDSSSLVDGLPDGGKT